jgi:hypothetical protein
VSGSDGTDTSSQVSVTRRMGSQWLRLVLSNIKWPLYPRSPASWVTCPASEILGRAELGHKAELD